VRIDAHAHVAHEGWIGEPWWQGLSRMGASILGVPADTIREHALPAYFDEDGSGQLGAMDEAGLDLAVLFNHDWTLAEALGRPPVGWREANEWYASFAERHSERIRWGFGADPRHDGALEAFQEAVRDRGAVCLKIHPSAGFSLDDPVVYPFLEEAGRLGVPAVFHVGPEVTPLPSRWSEPSALDQVAADFPDLKIQAAHTGNAAWREIVAVASVKPNVYCELSGWQHRFLANPTRFYDNVREVLDYVGHRRVMWGTDAPYYRALVTDADWIRAFTDAPDGTFSAEEVEAILGGTAAEFNGLA
jgi:predicted TIM-barrel fold metal-dependent hydrolase